MVLKKNFFFFTAIAKKIANLPCEAPFPRSRVVVITQGKDPIIVIENGQATQHPVSRRNKKLISRRKKILIVKMKLISRKKKIHNKL